MTLRTITFDESIYKLVPRELSDEMLQSALGDISFFNSEYIAVLKRKYCALVEAAPEYQEPAKEMICSRCGADRLKESCRQADIHCPMVGIAQDIGKDEEW